MSATAVEQMSNNTQIVSWEFVQLYYKTLNEKPEIMKDFYKNQSKLIRGEEGEPISVCQGLKEIDNNILQKKYKNVIVDFTNIDCLEVFEKKILLQVLGSLSNNGDPPRKFVQTVILDTQPNGYYVLQDIFRYLNDDVKNTFDVEEESSSQLVEEINTNDTNNNNAAAPTTSSTVNIDSASKGKSVGSNNIMETQHLSKESSINGGTDNNVENHLKSQINTTNKINNTVEEKSNDTAENDKSTTTTTNNDNQNQNNNIPKVTTGVTNKVITSSSPQINTSVPSNKTSTNTKLTSWATVVSSPTATDNKNQLSLYVRWNNGGDVNVTHGALLDLFKKYGEIRNFNLVEKKSCAFVEFSSKDVYQKVLEKKTFTDQNLLGSTTIIVEERMSHGGGRGGGDRRNSNSMGRPPSSRS
nr:14974_t:CDS:2 [Entrophospora candida]